jgi:hypothetical protein
LRDPIRLLVETPRAGALVLFSISPDGAVHRLYPGPGDDRFPVEPGERLQVPLAEHVEAGFRLVATAPTGRETVFALTLEDARAKPPEGDPTPDGWLVAYPFSGPSSPAAEFVRWVAQQLDLRVGPFLPETRAAGGHDVVARTGVVGGHARRVGGSRIDAARPAGPVQGRQDSGAVL